MRRFERPGAALLLASFAATALLIPATPMAHAQDAHDEKRIIETALDYIEGWHTGDVARMRSAIHPELSKSIVVDGPNGRSLIYTQTALMLLQRVDEGIGLQTPEAKRRSEFVILDQYQNAAIVRVDANEWVDFFL